MKVSFKHVETIFTNLKCVCFLILIIIAAPSQASTAISGGIWMNYSYQTDNSDDLKTVDDAETLGDVNSEAFIVYVDHQQKNTPWKIKQ